MSGPESITIPGGPLALPDDDLDKPAPRPLRQAYRDSGDKPGVASLNDEPSEASPAGRPVIHQLDGPAQRAAQRLAGLPASIRNESTPPTLASEPEPEAVIEAPDAGTMCTAQAAFDSAQTEAKRIGTITRQHETSLESLRADLITKQKENADRRAAGMLSSGKTNKTPALHDLSKPERELAESELTLSALRQRWAAAAKATRETRKALLELQTREAGARRQGLERRTVELEAEVTRARADAAGAGLQADNLRTQAAAIVVDQLVGWLRGSPSEIAKQAGAPDVIMDTPALRKILARWTGGFMAFDEKKISRLIVVDEAVVYFNTQTGKILAEDVITTSSISADGTRGGYSNRSGCTITTWKARDAIQDRADDLTKTLRREGKAA